MHLNLNDMDVNDKSEVEKKNDETLRYLSTDWQYNGANVANSSMGLIPNRNNPMSVCGDVVVGPSSSSGSMVDSFGPAVWEHLVNPLGFNEMNLPNGASTSDPLSMLKAGLFLPNMSEILPHSLSQFPADSAFIERAARFSSFNGGHYGDVLSPFSVHQPGNPFVRGGPMMHSSPQEVLPGNPVKPVSSNHSREIERNLGETSKDVSLPQEHEGMERSPTQNVAKVKRSREEAKQGVSMSGNDSDEAGFSGNGAQEDGPPSSGKRLGSKKGKWGNQGTEPGQASEVQQQSGEGGKTEKEKQQKGEHDLTPNSNKSNGKNGKQSSQASDAKEDYIHVRARRGQATNSHSLAERVRREKISERMKFLQDLVPGCSKVTGKAVMLDEIINYVQSLQRQVEFLSMKLATVNPRLDFDIERLIAKDMFSARAGPSAGLGFSPDMPMAYPPLHQAPHSMMHPGLPGIGNSSDALRRTITSQLNNLGGGYKEPPQQLPHNAWEDELHNVVQMGFNASTPLENQETNCSLPSGQMKAEP